MGTVANGFVTKRLASASPAELSGLPHGSRDTQKSPGPWGQWLCAHPRRTVEMALQTAGAEKLDLSQK